MNFYRTTRLMLSSAAILSFASSAFALDGVDLLKKINAASTLQGSTLAADGVDVEGTTVTLKGATIKPAATPDKGIALGNVTMNGVAEQSDGGYHIDQVSFADTAVTDDGVSISVTDMKLGGVNVPADSTKGGLDSLLLYQTAHMGAATVTKDGSQVFAIKEINAHLNPRGDKSGFDFDAGVTGLMADLSKVDDPKSKQVIEDMNLQHLNGNISVNGNWDLGPGTINVKQYAFDFKDIGKLDIALSISGYTLDFIKSIQDAIKASEANPNKEEAQQAMGLAMLGLMQQLTLNSAQIRFDDASITKRALDYAGKQQGVTGEQMANTLKGLTPIMLAQLNIPELQNAVTAAVNTYLDSPKSLTVSAAPDKPVPLPMIVGAAMGAPNTIPKVIGLKVSANN
ncbi:hypothetical protein [Rhizobium sp. BK376]|jgi:hypothetical protein|uniref:hypothetical protein n=1 Tax=Rhizobium sp. BK376 TaxID=2512149 RepID=UPI0010485223|nr:hypothetical protein [Rhizobium sp. BK376]TCR92960.1 hypothetical protein EV561_101405 [Rhizobium sp. BK376]